jgi:PAS domain S-box-containing protein
VTARERERRHPGGAPPGSPDLERLWDGLEGGEAYRALAEGVPAILYIDAIDDLSTNLYTSPQVHELLGYTAEEWMSQPSLFHDLLHPDDRERVTVLDHQSNLTGEPFRCEYRLIARDGRTVWFRDEAVLERDGAGRPVVWRGVMLDITEKKRAEEKLRRSLEILRHTMEQRRTLMQRLEEAQDEERRRIAADIHDDPIQVMSAADIRIQHIGDIATDEHVREMAAELHQTVTSAIDRLRHLLFELRPPTIDSMGLAGALEMYAARVAEEAGFTSLVTSALEREPSGELGATLFRIAQEALANVRKHAGATRVEVLLEGRDDGVLLRVADDGRGFDTGSIPAPEPGHLGMSAMPERAEIAGGWCRIQSIPGGGTTVECWLPHDATPGAAGRASSA